MCSTGEAVTFGQLETQANKGAHLLRSDNISRDDHIAILMENRREFLEYQNGWTTLGDIGHLDEDGYLYLTDRKSFLIISGGVNVYPQETENILISHPAVLDAAVIGIPDEKFGEAVHAIVQLTETDDVSSNREQALIHYCRDRLSAIKCPRTIEFRSTLPRSATGKLYKRKLKAEYWP